MSGEGSDPREAEIDALIDDLLKGPLPPAPPGVEERYVEMVRGHLERTRPPRLGVRQGALVAGGCALALVLTIGAGPDPLLVLPALALASGYVWFLNRIVGWVV